MLRTVNWKGLERNVFRLVSSLYRRVRRPRHSGENHENVGTASVRADRGDSYPGCTDHSRKMPSNVTHVFSAKRNSD
jgi:hypothetical protein